jgi:PPP family 3-phenylpropionic acid transporter
LVYGSHAMHDAFAVIRWSDAGIGTSAISFLWSEAVAAEVFVFFLVGPALIDRLGVHGAAALDAMAGVIRWSIAGVTTSVLLLSIIQPLHGLTFALLHLACMRMMRMLVQYRWTQRPKPFMRLVQVSLLLHWCRCRVFFMPDMQERHSFQ